MRTLRIGKAEVRAVDLRDLARALGHPPAWVKTAASRAGLKPGRDRVSVGKGEEKVTLLTLTGALRVACRDRGELGREVEAALASAMASSPGADALEMIAERLGRLEAAMGIRLPRKRPPGKQASSGGRPRKPVKLGRELSENISANQTAEFWRGVRCKAWDFLEDVFNGLAPVPAALRKDMLKLVRESGARESPMYRFARALERLAAREVAPFPFGRMRSRLMAYDNDTVKDSLDWLQKTGALSVETRPNARGRKTDYWTMVRRPLFVEDAAWLSSCMSLSEVAMGVTEEGGKKQVLGQTYGPDDPAWEKLKDNLKRFDMITGEE
jgi:hypothetical protein